MLRLSAHLIMSICLATLMAQALGAGYVWGTGKVDRVKLFRMLAIFHDVEIVSAADAPAETRGAVAEQASYEDIEKRRALESHYLETKAIALVKGLEEVRLERERLVIDLDQIKRFQAGFNQRLDTLQEQLTLEGIAQQRQIWTRIEPGLAKAQIMNMIESGEIDDVVVLLTDMPVATQSKIISEFQLNDEKERDAMNEILRKIRKGLPAVSLIEEARSELKSKQLQQR